MNRAVRNKLVNILSCSFLVLRNWTSRCIQYRYH